MAFNIEYIYTAIDKFTGTAKQVNESLKENQKNVEKTAKKFERLGKTMTNVGKSGVLKITAPIAAVSGFALKAAADLETMQVGFESMLGSEEKAAKLTKDLLDFTAKTPFQLPGVSGAAKQLLAFGVTQDKILPTLQNLGDIAAGSGAPIGDMAAIFGKVKAKGKAMTEELLQLSDRGIPIIDTLSKGFGVTGEQVFEMASKGQISFDVMQKALQHMTKEGSIFANQMEKQSATLAGVWSTLGDNITLTLGALGTEIEKTFDLKALMNDMIAGLQSLTVWFQELSPATKKWIVIGGAILAILPPIILALGMFAFSIAQIVAIAPLIGAAFGIMGAGLGFLFSPIVLIGVAVAALGFLFVKHFDQITLAASDLMTWLGGFFDWLQLGTTNAFESIAGFLDSVMSGIMEKITALMNRAQGLVGLGSALASGDLEAAKMAGLQVLTGADLIGGQSTSDVNINLNDPGKQVRSVESQTTGNANLNLGTNVG